MNESTSRDNLSTTPHSEKLIPASANDVKNAGHSRLDYKPLAIRSWVLLLVTSVYVSCIVAILALLVKSRKNLGVADLYTTETLPWESFLIRYLPQYLGAFLTAISQTIVSTLHRTMPYILLASYGNRDKVDITRQALTGYHTYFTPQQFFPYQRPFAIYIFQVIDYFSIFILNSLSTVLFVPGFDNNQSTYRWVMVDLVAIVMVYFMVLQAIALLSITIWLRGRETGLRWDIESIADLIVLIRHSNALMDIHELEKQDVSGRKPSKATERYEPRRLWLGYWKKGDKIVHTIGTKDPGPDLPLLPLVPKRAPNINQAPDREKRFSRENRFKHAPWFVTRQARIVWSSTCLVAAGLIILVTCTSKITENGFRPRVSTTPGRLALSHADMLWNFLPSLLATLLSLLWLNIDAFFKLTQPFVSLSRPSTAKESILVNYYYSFLPITLFNAIKNRHLRVVWVGIVSLMSFHLTVLAGGVFAPRYDATHSEPRMFPQTSALITLELFFTVYALSLMLPWTFAVSRKLPKKYYTLADRINLISQSRLLDDEDFGNLTEKRDLLAQLLLSRRQYFYGHTTGRDGKNQLTIDWVDGQGDEGWKVFKYSGTRLGEKYRKWRSKSKQQPALVALP